MNAPLPTLELSTGADPVASRPGRPVFNRIVTLRDSWAKQNEAT